MNHFGLTGTAFAVIGIGWLTTAAYGAGGPYRVLAPLVPAAPASGAERPGALELPPHVQAVAALRSLGAEVREKKDRDGQRSIAVSIKKGRWMGSGEALRWLKDIRDLKSLYLWNVEIEDSDLTHIAPLKDLEGLFIRASEPGAGITDAGLPYLAGLANLKKLSLRNTRVTVEGMSRLERLEKIRLISVDTPERDAMRKKLKWLFPRAGDV